MENIAKLIALRRLTDMSSDIATARLARAMVEEHALLRQLKDLEVPFDFIPVTIEEAQAFARAQRWRRMKRLELNAAMAKCRAKTQPLKEEAARMVARANVMQRLSEDAAKTD